MEFHKIAVLNGHFQPLREVRVDPTGAAVHSGWGVYSTVRIYRGHPFNVVAHAHRLEADARRTGIPLPKEFAGLSEDLGDLARRNGVDDGIGRVYVLGGPMGRFSASGPSTADILILTRDLRPHPPGESLWTAPFRIHTLNPLAGAKTTSNLAYIQCRREAIQQRYDEALILNENGHVVEVSTGNVFWVRDGVLRTPDLSTGCLDGSTRDLLIELAKEGGVTVEEGAFALEDLLAADEAFVSSVSREVTPVARVGEEAFPEVPGPIAASLQERFQQRLQRWLGELEAEEQARAEAEDAEAAARSAAAEDENAGGRKGSAPEDDGEPSA